jgi:hypothetical protein
MDVHQKILNKGGQSKTDAVMKGILGSSSGKSDEVREQVQKAKKESVASPDGVMRNILGKRK